MELIIAAFYVHTRIMINKGMVNKGKYWILEKNKGLPVSFWKILKGFFKLSTQILKDIRVLIRVTSTQYLKK